MGLGRRMEAGQMMLGGRLVIASGNTRMIAARSDSCIRALKLHHVHVMYYKKTLMTTLLICPFLDSRANDE